MMTFHFVIVQVLKFGNYGYCYRFCLARDTLLKSWDVWNWLSMFSFALAFNNKRPWLVMSYNEALRRTGLIVLQLGINFNAPVLNRRKKEGHNEKSNERRPLKKHEQPSAFTAPIKVIVCGES